MPALQTDWHQGAEFHCHWVFILTSGIVVSVTWLYYGERHEQCYSLIQCYSSLRFEISSFHFRHYLGNFILFCVVLLLQYININR